MLHSHRKCTHRPEHRMVLGPVFPTSACPFPWCLRDAVARACATAFANIRNHDQPKTLTAVVHPQSWGNMPLWQVREGNSCFCA